MIFLIIMSAVSQMHGVIDELLYACAREEIKGVNLRDCLVVQLVRPVRLREQCSVA